MELQTPKRILHYNLVEKLGEGINGSVFKALDTGFQQVVVLKLLRPEIVRRREFRQHIKPTLETISGLHHPNTASILDVFESVGQTVIVSEYVEGIAVDELVKSHPLPMKRFLDLAIQIARGLDFAHNNGIRHGNIQPSNIIIQADDTVKLLDFGLRRRLDGPLNETSDFPLEIIPYMAPEDLRNEPLRQTADIYSIGVIFYLMLTGSLPFSGANKGAVINAVLYDNPDFELVKACGIPRDIELLLKRLLARKRSERCTNSGELVVTLESISSFEKELASRIEDKWQHWSPRLYLLISLLAVLLILAWTYLTMFR